MDRHEWLAEQFETNRSHLRSVAYRMLGSLTEAEDAVQETWIRVSRSDMEPVANPAGWMTTAVARICLDALRTRKSRREEVLESEQSPTHPSDGFTAEEEAILADSVGLAMLVILDALEPAERLAFVLHDMFDLPFEEIALVLDRSPEAARQLASRARRRIQGTPALPPPDLGRHQETVAAFLAASRHADFSALLELLDPKVVVRADQIAARTGMPAQIEGSTAVAQLFAGRAQLARMALVDGGVGIVVAPRGRLFLVLRLTLRRGRIAGIEAIADPQHLAELKLALLAADLPDPANASTKR